MGAAVRQIDAQEENEGELSASQRRQAHLDVAVQGA